MIPSIKVLFYGALGNGKFTVGGGETGNYRTIHLLKKNNFEVITMHKPYPVRNLTGYMVYTIRMFFKLFSFYRILLNSNIKTVHISGFYLHLIYHEYILILIARALNKKTIYELRGGGVIEAYKKRSFFYRYIFKATLKKASVILCQGKTYINFLNTLTKVDVFYYPNYVFNNFLSSNSISLRKNTSTIQLVYFGRIVKSKNVDLLLLICKELLVKNVDFKMEIIGRGEDEYMSYLNELIETHHLAKFVTLSSPIKLEHLKQKLIYKHFFLFPSNEKREGHSNALTEAMANGVVPICSNAGFNKEIVDENALIISEYDPLKYASIIREIWENGEWEKYSVKVLSRIKSNYTEQTVEKIILKAYND